MDRVAELPQITPIQQRLQVYVEHVKIADSEDVWFLMDTSHPVPVFRYLIPKGNVVQNFTLPSECYELKSPVSALRLSLRYPYRIEIEQVGWLYSGLLYQSRELGEMIAFNAEEVSYRLDPL